MLDYTSIQLEAACLQPLATAGMATIENRQVILFCHRVDGSEQRQEILLRINVLFPMSGQQDIFAFLQVQPRVNVRSFDVGQILMQYFRHGRSRHIGTFLGHARSVQITAGMFRVTHIHIRDDIHNAAICLFGQAFVKATVACLHMEDGNVQAFGTYHAQAGIGVAQHQHGIGLHLHHQFVALIYDITHCCT